MFDPKYALFGHNWANLGPNMADKCAADQLFGSYGFGARAVSGKMPIYFLEQNFFLQFISLFPEC